jgi:ATP synthase subunit 6
MNFYQPLEQFEIILYKDNIIIHILNIFIYFFKYKYYHFYLTNSVFYLILILFSLYFFLYVPRTKIYVLPRTSWDILLESVYIAIYTMVVEQTNKHYRLGFYFPIFFTVFLFIFMSNFIGLTPYGFTVTAFIIKTFSLSFSFLIGLTIAGFFQQGPKFFNLFIPTGIPKVLFPLLMVIEIISYVSRAFSLGIRLFANMMSGHSLLNILAGFTLSLSKKSLIYGFFPFLVVLSITFLELGIAFLQSYVFVVLLCIYCNDALNDAHDSH